MASLHTVAQDTDFREYNSSKINLNPAFAGSDSAFVLSSANKFHPGDSFERSNSFFFSADNYFHFLRGGLAIRYENIRNWGGRSKTNQVHLSYASHFELFKHKLAIQPAFEVGVFQNVERFSFIAPDGSTTQTPGPDPQIPWSGYKKNNIDFSAGLLLFTKRFYGGLALHHINTPEYRLFSYQSLPIRYTVHAGANLTAGNFILSPNILIMSQQDYYNYIQIGLRTKYKMLTFGLDYVAMDNIIPEIGLQNRFFKLSYSYSYIVDTYGVNPATHELHFNWFFKHKNKKQLSLRMI
jgi:type IX secretion system PorP/SprF family membrane protein